MENCYCALIQGHPHAANAICTPCREEFELWLDALPEPEGEPAGLAEDLEPREAFELTPLEVALLEDFIAPGSKGVN